MPGKLEVVRYLVEELGCDMNARWPGRRTQHT